MFRGQKNKCRFLKKDIDFWVAHKYMYSWRLWASHESSGSTGTETGRKCPKLLINERFCPVIHAADSISPTVNIKSGLKDIFTVCGVNNQSNIIPSDKIDIFESPKTDIFFQSRVYFANERDWFLNLIVTFITMTLLPHQSIFFGVNLVSKYRPPPPTPTPETKPLTDFNYCSSNWTSFSFSGHFLHKFLSN